MAVEIRYHCKVCKRERRTGICGGADRCPECGEEITFAGYAEPMDQCACCGGTEFFLRKDFPQKLGLFLVIVFGLVASVAYYYQRVMVTFSILAALVVVDVIIYFFIGKVVVCYKCRAEYRGFPYNSRLGGFDLATSEKYRN